MASTINFKRLVQTDAAHVLEDLAEALRLPALVVDSAKRTLWGDAKAKASGGEFPVWLAGRIIGYVLGPPQSYCMASLLSHLSQQELEKREAMEQVLDKESEISLIHEIHSRLGASLDVAEIAMALVDEATSTVESTGASVMLLNEETGRLEIAAAFGRKMNDRPVLKPGVGIVGDVLLTGIPEVVPDVSQDARYVPGSYPICSLICVPIAAADRIIGAINISNQRPANYGEPEVKHVLALATHAAAAIDKARLHQTALKETCAPPAPEAAPPAKGAARLLCRIGGNGDSAKACCKETASILFSGIRAYSGHYDSMGVEENFSFINDYVDAIGLPVLRNNGVIGDFRGDGIMALFPDMEGKGPEQAVRAAIEMHRDLRDFSEQRRKAAKLPVDMGIGIHTGSISVGHIELGGERESVVLGEAAGIAAKLERLSKIYGLRVAVSGATWEALPKGKIYGLREADMVAMPGKDAAVTLYEVFGADPRGMRESKAKNLSAYEDALGLFRTREWEKAGRIFARLHEFMPFDKLSLIYWRRCQAFIKSPPGNGWVGVSRLSDM
ncbi:Adenylate cyclase, class 3 [Desulfatibacillum alkenivorans DSM 16219]|jgi:class 3 adenylate cyclase|uniref:Adenylate cyclase, class 3 n=1 Tax=Desulfatibacillum alkenivorans DSM 16219 TaxID=1121393 RepID=A0A1M6MTK8_9BACT|nr:GAF domain-containing protein [Desulfatibacillum alkenivorans]SHJ86583.1 Adenylate cyclase, class 3 [Desulfatibacillum alkenivorans DSM 16219]